MNQRVAAWAVIRGMAAAIALEKKATDSPYQYAQAFTSAD